MLTSPLFFGNRNLSNISLTAPELVLYLTNLTTNESWII